MAVQVVSDQEFESAVLDSSIPVFIDFFADWCGPCKAVAPAVEKLAEKYAGRVKVVKVDVDRSPSIAQAFRIQSIPTFAVVKGSEVVDHAVGARDASALDAMIAKWAGPADSSAPETWEADKVKLAIDGRLVQAVDLRAANDFARAHLPGAINLPPEKHAEPLELADRTRRLVLYARTDDGVMDVAKAIAKTGYRVIVMKGGLLAWEASMYPIERGGA